MSLTVAVASMLRGGFDVKAGLSSRAKVVHRLTTSLSRLSDDIEQTFFVSMASVPKNGISRRTRGIFKVEKAGGTDKLSLTTKTHRPIVAGKYESDLTFVVYELRDSKTSPGRKSLYRGETNYIPEDFKEPPPMRLLAEDVKTFTIEYWTGERWSKDAWDSTRGDWINKIPKLVRITLEANAKDYEEGDPIPEDQQPTEQMMTVVLIADSWEYKELKDQDKSIKWGNL